MDVQTVTKTVYVTVAGDDGKPEYQLRIEVLLSEDGTYSTRAYKQISAVITPEDIDRGEEVPPTSETIWVNAELESASGSGADEAIGRAFQSLGLTSGLG
jgi:hypothetical protein